MRIAICFGTRPEIIKLFLLSRKMGSQFDVANIFTGQHHSLFDDVKHLIPNIDWYLPIEEYKDLSMLYSNLIQQLCSAFKTISPDLVIVQGDTASAYCAAFCAFTMGIKVGHVEAGLRTNDLQSPFPEEFNRQVISKIAYYNWCPTQLSMDVLKGEKVKGQIILTGNTVVDAIKELFGRYEEQDGNEIIITLHRRENRDHFESILSQISILSEKHPEFSFVFPAHPNPIIQGQLKNLSNKIKIVNPMKYEDFILRLKKCKGIISDSGGLQEEAVCLRKKIIVCRNNTERSEASEIGISKVVGREIINNFDWLIEPVDGSFINPYGNGNACKLILESLL